MEQALLEALLREIEGHAASSHEVFTRLMKARPDTEALEEWLMLMATFSAHARVVHDLPENLRFHGDEAQARVIEEIRENERHNGHLYYLMTRRLLGREPQDTKLRHSRAILECERVFAARAYEDLESVFYSLGAYLALEIMAKQHIIPGQIDGFVTSGHYGVSLRDPGMHYLRKHRREYNRDALRGERIKSAMHIAPENPHAFETAKLGIREFMDSLEGLYRELSVII